MDPLGQPAKGSICLIVAEPRVLIREKLAGVLAREEFVWSVTQVADGLALLRSAQRVQPDWILADLALMERELVAQLRAQLPHSRLLALVDCMDPTCHRLASERGLDGLLERGRVGEQFKLLLDGDQSKGAIIF